MHIRLVMAGLKFELPCDLAHGLKRLAVLKSASNLDRRRAECVGYTNLVVGETDGKLFVSNGLTRYIWSFGGVLPRDETDELVRSWAKGMVPVVTTDVDGHDVRSRLRDLGMKVPDRFPMLGSYTTIIPPGWECEFEGKDLVIKDERRRTVVEAAYPHGLQSTFRAYVK